MSISVAVLIPYFQRSAGILRVALNSIADQVECGRLTAIVVDDGSPAPARQEIAASRLDPASVILLEQANSGPGTARNRALDALLDDTTFIAFLDSDDYWLPGHLTRAVATLSRGGDFYFSNFFEPGSTRDQFSVHRRIDLRHHEPITGVSDCFWFTGSMVDQIFAGNVIETSTVVYRRSTLGHVRFPEDLRNAFEDHIFWLRIATASRRISFSSIPSCRYGLGVNMWRSSFEPGSDWTTPKLVNEAQYLRRVRGTFASTEAQKRALTEKIRATRRSVVANLLARVRRGRSFQGRHVLRYLRVDPLLILLGPPIAAYIAFKRLLRGRTRTEQ
jgi:succinoglycan biosynthesis protein ExoW